MRTPVTLKIKFKSSNLDQFIERYSVDVSRGGIFIRTKEPLAVGTQLKFEFQLQDASSLISGEGTVVWIREHDPTRSGVAPGMGVRFDKLATTSQQVLDRILNEKGKRGESSMESRFDAGVRASASASGNISTPMAAQPHQRSAHNDFGGGDSKSHTPLPAPAPGLDSGADEFGEESTRVMQDAVVQALADRTREEHAAKPAAPPTVEVKPTTPVPAPMPVAPAPPPVEAESKSNGKAEAKVEPPKEALKEAPKEAAAKEPPKDAVKEAAKEPATAKEAAAAKEPPKDAVKESAGKPAVAAPVPQKSSALPMMAALAIGVIAVGGYVMYRNQEEPDAQGKGGVSQKLVQAGRNARQPITTPPTEVPEKPAEVAPVKPEEAKPVEAVANPAKPEEAKPVEAVAAKPVGITVPITTDPPGAQVTVDGKPLPAPTPTEVTGLEAGKSYAIGVGLKGFHDWKTTIKAKAGEKLATRLVANEKLVEISSTPAGADVLLDGRRVGKTPFVIHKLDVTKPHELAIKHAGFVAQTRAIGAGETFESKGDKDVLAVAMTLEAEAKATPPAPHNPKHVAPKKPAATASAPTATPEVKPAPTEEKPAVAEKPADEKPAPDKTAEKPAAEKPAPDKTAEKPAAEKPAAEKPAAEKPAAEKPAADKPADKPADKEKPNLKTPSWMQDSNSSDKSQ